MQYRANSTKQAGHVLSVITCALNTAVKASLGPLQTRARAKRVIIMTATLTTSPWQNARSPPLRSLLGKVSQSGQPRKARR